MTRRPRAAARAVPAALVALALLGGCMGPTGRVVTGPLPADAEVQVSRVKDSTDAALRLQWRRGLAGDTLPCLASHVTGRLARDAGDTLWFRDVSYVVPTGLATDPACRGRGEALVLAPAATTRREVLRPASWPAQVGGTVLLWAAVGGTILLLVSAADGIIDAVGRWF